MPTALRSPAAPAPAVAAAPVRPLLAEPEWRSRAEAHAARADALSAAHRERRSRGDTHPVEDFLWTYYPMKPAELRRWHPGVARLAGGAAERAGWRYYATAVDDAAAGAAAADAAAAVDLPAFFARRAGTVDYVERLLAETLARPPRFGCFGLHEWAMVYRLTPEQLRHTALELRVGHAETDRVVEANPIGCSHFDAYRFFTPADEPLNELRPTRETQPAMEQSGCLHAGMDVYKWAFKLGPIVPGEVLLDAFVLARDIREVDMRASPYDVSAYTGSDGERLVAIPIETPAGKRDYAGLQRGFAERGDALRRRVLAAIAEARAALAAG